MSTSPIFARLEALRAAMARAGVAAVVVPSADPHLSEYLPPRWQAREWFSGFTGSAGTLVVTAKGGGLWTDSRYFSQAETELAGSGLPLMKLNVAHTPEHVAWLASQFGDGDTVAVAGDSVSVAGAEGLAQRLAGAGASLRTDLDLPGAAWADRPARPAAPVFAHEAPYAPVSRADKLQHVRTAMRRAGATHHLVSSLDDIAWLTNLRGADVDYNPVFLAHLLVEDTRATLFIDAPKLPPAVKAALAADGISLADYGTAAAAVAALPDDATLLFDPSKVVVAILDGLPASVKQVRGPAPSTAAKARKTPEELEHIREAMRRDGAALARAFRRIEAGLASGEPLTELDVDTIVREARAAQDGFVGESFSTIAGYQANGALPHYRATEEGFSPLAARGLLLVDSGGQYLGGTTDITRVLALGPVTDEQKRDSTLVLKGMIALSRARFPKGASGPQLDALARAPLWAAGMDFGHGTGHGVGYFLNVHEGPHGIRPPVTGGALVPLETGMITSIEPGLYKPGRHGIRHENLAVVTQADQTEFGEFYAFETLTLCPFDRRGLEPRLLEPSERAWLDDYHATVRAALSPLLDGEDRAWLEWHCAPL
ncbi:aminopeptidase P family protein [Luteibacter aegosomatissinici]|uniref:aminopeptidase P family protein n=1 Tax=Luteibacter aegosomatissinici TaxID=2911539 RepID=UPI001FF747CE|nr:aminopeptidase P family protein [Luteibacter aegosomatissinici]UPG93159.1 aminopeptidase P family protein [Luteibacter aegosomatissinici]